MPAALLVVLAAVLWGTTGTAQALGPEDIDPLVVGWLRMVVGSLGLVVLARTRRATAAALPRAWLVAAIASIAAYQLTFFGGVRLAGVALGTAVGIGSAPIWGGLIDWRFDGWRPSPRWVVAAAIAIAGAVLVAGETGDAERPGLGLLLAVTAGATYAMYAYALQQLARAEDADRVAATTFVGAAVVLAPVALLAGGGDALAQVARAQAPGRHRHRRPRRVMRPTTSTPARATSMGQLVSPGRVPPPRSTRVRAALEHAMCRVARRFRVHRRRSASEGALHAPH